MGGGSQEKEEEEKPSSYEVTVWRGGERKKMKYDMLVGGRRWKVRMATATVRNATPPQLGQTLKCGWFVLKIQS